MVWIKRFLKRLKRELSRDWLTGLKMYAKTEEGKTVAIGLVIILSGWLIIVFTNLF